MLFLFKFSVFTKFLFSVQFQQKRGGRAHNFSTKLSRLVRVFEEGKCTDKCSFESLDYDETINRCKISPQALTYLAKKV